MKVVLIEDQNLLSSTLIKALEGAPDVEVVAHSDRASDAMQLCRTHQPDVVIMDIFTRDGNGIECTAQLKQAFPQVKVLILTGVQDDRLVQAAEEAGADLFARKSISLDELLEFVAYAKRPYRVFPRVHPGAEKPIRFSDMEVKILALLARGKTSKEIAADLLLSYGTVRLYISRMYASSGLRSRAQLVAYAVRSGLIEQA